MALVFFLNHTTLALAALHRLRIGIVFFSYDLHYCLSFEISVLSIGLQKLSCLVSELVHLDMSIDLNVSDLQMLPLPEATNTN